MDPGPIFTIDTSSTVTVYLLQTTITFHTIRLILCYSKPVSLTTSLIRWGKVLSLCCAGLRVACNTCVTFPSSFWFDNLGLYWWKTCCCAHHTLLLGFPTKCSMSSTINKFYGAVAGEAKDVFTRGVLHFLSLYFVFSLLCFFCLVLFASFQKLQKKLV